jgi:glycosyltransferase involved in cell wall biosynthesis
MESVPPKFYGGTERIVSYLTEELVNQGHEVTLFASGDSQTAARLHPVCEEALRLSPRCQDALPYHLLTVEKVLQEANNFDVVHFHTDHLHFSAFRRHPVPFVNTMHGRLDLPDLAALYREFDEVPMISISNSQRRPLAWANWLATIYHGLPEQPLRLQPEPGKYLAFLGRICPEKRPDRAIRIALQAGMPLKIAAKVDRVDQDYYDNTIKPMLDHPLIEYIGEITESEKNEFLGNAYALIFPIDWPEPFGLTMIEAMACGTPVIAFRAGSVPEVIDEGVTGFVVDNHEQAVAALSRIDELNRQFIRQVFEHRFSARRMAQDYVSVYQDLIDRGFGGPRLVPSPSGRDNGRRIAALVAG